MLSGLKQSYIQHYEARQNFLIRFQWFTLFLGSGIFIALLWSDPTWPQFRPAFFRSACLNLSTKNPWILLSLRRFTLDNYAGRANDRHRFQPRY